MTDQVIIDAAARFARKTVPAGVDPLWTRTPEETRALFAPSVKTLPFVSVEWKNDYWPESMWTDVPTDDWRADRERGEHFARLTIGALMADRCSHSVALAAIFQAIVNDAIRRRVKGGKGSRVMLGAVHGYLEELADFIVSECRRSGPPAA
jgi:hypothetical protein